MTKDEAILELIKAARRISPTSADEHEYLSILFHEAERLVEAKSLKNEEKQQTFEIVVCPLMQWLNENYPPHHTILVDHTSAEILRGVLSYNTSKYLKD